MSFVASAHLAANIAIATGQLSKTSLIIIGQCAAITEFNVRMNVVRFLNVGISKAT